MNKITPRTWTFIFAGIALLALAFLSISLSSLAMSAGKPISFSEIAPQVYDTNISTNWERIFLAILRVLLIIGWILLPFYIILLFISKTERKNFIRRLAGMLPFFIMLYILVNSQIVQKVADQFSPRLFGTQNLPGEVGTPGPTPEFVPPPHWVTTVAVIAIAFAITLILTGFFFLMWRRSRAQLRLKEPLQKVEREAQAALEAIISGRDLREAILRCYLQMVETIREYRGFNREQDMTPREFELFLQKHGLPRDPVHQLTWLFEEVRYGTMKPGRKEEQTAVASLSAIVSACQRAAQKRGVSDGPS